MKVSVILCTYNRSQSLLEALESLAAQVLPETIEWEVLVVDNNSRDQTREVVEEFLPAGTPIIFVMSSNRNKDYVMRATLEFERRGARLSPSSMTT